MSKIYSLPISGNITKNLSYTPHYNAIKSIGFDEKTGITVSVFLIMILTALNAFAARSLPMVKVTQPNNHADIVDVNESVPTTCTTPVLTVPIIRTVVSGTGQCGAEVEFEATASGAPAPEIIYYIGDRIISSPHLFKIGTTTVTATATNECGTISKTFNVEVVDEQARVIPRVVGPIVASYYSDKNWSDFKYFDTYKYSEIVPAISYDWGENSPNNTELGVNYYSIRYTASFTAPVTGIYTFRSHTDDGVRLYVGSQLLIDRWVAQPEKSWIGSILLTAGQTVPVQMDYYEFGGVSVAELYYTTPGSVEKLFQTDFVNLPVQLDASGNATIVVADIDPKYTANCGITNITLSKTNFTCSDVGSNTVTVTSTDANGNKESVIALVTVSDNEQPVIYTNGNQVENNTPGECGALVTVTAWATDNCSVGTPVGVRDDGLSLSAPFPVGTTTIAWNVTDVNGNAAEQVTQTVTVNITPTEIYSVTAPLDPVAVNTSVNLTVAFTDDRVTYAAINWGDGTSPENVPNPASSFVTPHTYTAAGVYTVTVTLYACGVKSAEFKYKYIVVYDPSAGFVTGGGWIESPAGAYNPPAGTYAAGTDGTGKASFGFFSKYKKGATVPEGQTQFQFHAGNFNFHSTIYSWLVISGAKAQFKGEGTVNGVGTYGFILTAVDGQLSGTGDVSDKFRIKIWNKLTNEVVYDNQRGDGEDAIATTVLRGGSVVIHDSRIAPITATTTNKAVVELMGASFYSYPTSFSDKTTIAFSLDKEEAYSLEVYDIRGALVKTLASGGAEANKLYEFVLSADGLPEGIYITRLITTSGARSLKAVLKR